MPASRHHQQQQQQQQQQQRRQLQRRRSMARHRSTSIGGGAGRLANVRARAAPPRQTRAGLRRRTSTGAPLPGPPRT
eukprot:scaffold2285_cov380-Prasinococcus_capsulatus_cf.AAC.13